MKTKNVIAWILLLGIVVLLMSTSVQAKELTEVNASDILEKIVNGEDVFLRNVRIIGELNLSKIELETVHNAQREKDIVFYVGPPILDIAEAFEIPSQYSVTYHLEKELKIVENNITIRNSIFEEDVDFSNTKFRKNVDFEGTSFSSNAYFGNAVFAGTADFRNAVFAGSTGFDNADFADTAYFWDADFTGYTRFWDTDFAGTADFMHADFAGNAYFVDADFAGNAGFWFANFAGEAVFADANFAVNANFRYADFAVNALFRNANFTGDAIFEHADFVDGADFSKADFNGSANFGYADFNSIANYLGANFSFDASFYSTIFNKVSFTRTSFTNVSLIESDFNRMKVEWSTLKDALVFNGPTYIKLIKNFREIEQFEDADAAYYQYRQLSQANKKMSFSKLMDVVAGASCGYGVKPWNAASLAVVIILIFIPIYGLRGGIRRSKENDGKDEEDVSSRRKTWNAFVDAFYFSMVTFTTIGYGDLYPADRYRKVAVMIEGLFGWLILALFLVTLANVMIRP